MRKRFEEVLSEIEQYQGKIYPGTQMMIHGFAGRNKHRQITVHCSSPSRGNFVAVWSEIRRGNTKGTVAGESRITRNRYECDGDILKVYFRDGNAYFICDKCDEDLVTSYTWYLNSNGYARESHGQYFHQLAMQPSNGCVVDHINRDQLDNRRCNLRICSQLDNSHNMKVFSTNTSGHPGVAPRKSGTFQASIVHNYQHIHLGTFDTYEEACYAYDAAKEKYHAIEA